MSGETFGQYMRDCRIIAGIPINRLAADTGWSQGYLSEMERGTRLPTPDKARLRIWADRIGADYDRALYLSFDQPARDYIDGLREEIRELRARLLPHEEAHEAMLDQFDKPW